MGLYDTPTAGREGNPKNGRKVPAQYCSLLKPLMDVSKNRSLVATEKKKKEKMKWLALKAPPFGLAIGETRGSLGQC